MEKLPELDDYSAILAYTQSVKEKIGVQDSFTQKKTEKEEKDESEAKKLI